MLRRNNDGINRFQIGFPRLAPLDEPGQETPTRTRSKPTKRFSIPSSDFYTTRNPKQSKQTNQHPTRIDDEPKSHQKKRKAMLPLGDLICSESELKLMKPCHSPAKAFDSRNSLTSLSRRALLTITNHENQLNSSHGKEKNPETTVIGLHQNAQPINPWMVPLLEKPIEQTKSTPKRHESRCRSIDLFAPDPQILNDSNRSATHVTPHGRKNEVNLLEQNLGWTKAPQSHFEGPHSVTSHHRRLSKRLKLAPLIAETTSTTRTRQALDSPCPASKKGLASLLVAPMTTSPQPAKTRKQNPLSHLIARAIYTPERPNLPCRPLMLPPPPFPTATHSSSLDISPPRRQRGKGGPMSGGLPSSALAERARAVVKAEKTGWEMWRSDAQRTRGQSCRAHPYKLLTIVAREGSNPWSLSVSPQSVVIEGIDDEEKKTWTVLLSLINSTTSNASRAVGGNHPGVAGPVTTTAAELKHHYKPGVRMVIYHPWYVVKDSVILSGRFGVEETSIP